MVGMIGLFAWLYESVHKSWYLHCTTSESIWQRRGKSPPTLCRPQGSEGPINNNHYTHQPFILIPGELHWRNLWYPWNSYEAIEFAIMRRSHISLAFDKKVKFQKTSQRHTFLQWMDGWYCWNMVANSPFDKLMIKLPIYRNRDRAGLPSKHLRVSISV